MKALQVPFNIVGFRAHDLVVLIPAKNEAATVSQVIQEIRSLFLGEIVIIDDASTDNTAKVARAAGATVISLVYSLGAWGAIQTGMRYALKHGYQSVITMDADGQHQAESLPRLYAPLEKEQADVVIGAFPQRGSLARQFAWSLFRSLSGLTLEDLTSGLRAYNRKAIRLLASQKATLLDYQDMGVLLLIQHAGLRVREEPVTMNQRLNGHSRVFSSWWVVGKYMLHTLTLSLARANRLPFSRQKQGKKENS